MYDSNVSTEPQAPRGWKAVYTIVERPGLEKKLWVRIGTAFVNSDQSINVKLDALPTNGQINIREPNEAELERSRMHREARAQRMGAQHAVIGGAA